MAKNDNSEIEEIDSFGEDDYNEEDDYDFKDSDSNEEELYAVSRHDNIVIFNREDGTWYQKTYKTVEIAMKVLEIEENRLQTND